jgi:hypothetical protein
LFLSVRDKATRHNLLMSFRMKILYLFLLLVLSVAIVACDDDDSLSNGTGQITIEFDNRAGEEDLELSKDYVNGAGESFRIAKLNYYISNIKLTTSDGNVFVVPQDSSYFLIIEEHEESQAVHLRNIPSGNYNQISFTIGVDSLRSTMDVSKRHGVLDPAQGHDGMYWTWNSGYIFFKMEGTSPAAPTEQDNKFYYHIGGYGGYETSEINNIRTTTLDMGSAVAQVRLEKNPQVHLHVDVLEFFNNPTSISIADHPLVMFSEYSKTVSGNYVNMFKYHHVHN